MKIVLLEDEAIVIQDLVMRLTEMGYEEVKAFTNVPDFTAYTQHNIPDLCIVDINLKGELSGIDAVKELKSKCNIPIIYLTAQGDQQTLEEALETTPSAYLLKPFNEFELHAAIELAMLSYKSKLQQASKDIEVIDDKVFFKYKNKFQSIAISDLLFLQAEGNYTSIHTACAKYVVICQLGKFEHVFKEQFMFRCHRSYIINLHKVNCFDDMNIFVDDVQIPLSKNYKKQFLERLRII